MTAPPPPSQGANDRSTSQAGLASDGIFHAFGWSAVAIGLVMVSDLRRLVGVYLVAAGGRETARPSRGRALHR